MRKALVSINKIPAGILCALTPEGPFTFQYLDDYHGSSVSLTMPVRKEIYEYSQFPPFFDGLLPEGMQLDALLRQAKLNPRDYFAQLVQVGQDLVGNVTVAPLDAEHD